MNSASKMLVVTAFGLVTSVLTALLLFAAERYMNIAIYGFTFWFIVPVGAIISGLVASAGYFWGAKVMNYRPDRALLINILAVSLMTYFLRYYLDYATMEVEGRAIRSVLSFPQFMNIDIVNQSYTIGHSTSSPGIALGSFGYVFAALQVLGFALGGFAIYGMLQGQPYCESCSRYLHSKGRQDRYSSDEARMREIAGTVKSKIETGFPQQAIVEQAALGEAKAEKAHTYKSSLVLQHCTQCGMHRLNFTLAAKNQNSKEVEWLPIAEYTTTTDTQSTLSF